MSQSLNIKLRGLYTFPNDFSAIPDGALSLADNIVIDRDSIAEPRRGFTYLAHATARADFAAVYDSARKLFFFKDSMIAHLYNSNTTVFSLCYFNATSGWTSIDAAFNPPNATVKCRAEFANGNMYLTRDTGVQRIDAITAAPVRCGVSQAYDMNGVVDSASTPTWLLPNYATAYRVVWGKKDANGNILLGAPSGRGIGNNGTIGNTSIIFSIDIPDDIVAAYALGIYYFYQVYRSRQVAPISTGPTVYGIPDDELRQVYEGIPSAGEIAAGHIHFGDLCTEELLKGPYLYTNNSQEGAAYSNIIPPKALDIASFRDCMFYANIREQQTFYLTFNNVAFSGADTDTITIDGITFKAAHDPFAPPAAPYFFFYAGGTEAQNRADTAQNFCYYFNLNSTNYYATYLSTPSDMPGKIVIRSISLGTAALSATSNVGGYFIPALPASGTSQSSTDSYAPNGLAYSKPLQPEAVPLVYRMSVGSKDSEILRILPLRDSLFILKEDGVWRLFGSDPSNFQVALLDSTANCIAPDTACVMNNQIFALTTQGVVTISETGVTIMSRPIEGDLLKLLSINKTVLQQQAFAVPYESQRAYHLWLPTVSGDTHPTQYYRYNTITNNWTRGTLEKSCGGVNPYDDLMYLGDPHRYWMDKERKSFTSFDYADYADTLHIASVSGTTVTLTDASSIVVGQVLYQTDSLWGEVVTLVDSTHVKTRYAVAYTHADAQLFDTIKTALKWIPCTFSNPGYNKQVRETSLLFLSDFYGAGGVTFESDISAGMITEPVTGCMAAPWGQFPWGQAPWGMGSTPRRRPLRVMVPRVHQRCSLLTLGFDHDCMFSPWALQGVSVIGNNISEKVWTEGSTV